MPVENVGEHTFVDPDTGDYTDRGTLVPQEVGKRPSKQYGVAVDLLSAGEIHGIVGGLSGVYLNGAEILSPEDYTNVQPSVLRGYNSSGAPLTFTTDQTVPTNITLPQYGVVREGLGSFTTNTAANVNSHYLRLANGSINSLQTDLARAARNYKVRILARVVHTDGDFWVAVERLDSAASDHDAIKLYSPLTRAVPSGSTVYVDWAGKIVSTTSNSITFERIALPSTLNPNVFSSSSKTNIRLGGALSSPTSDENKKNFKESFLDYRKGTRYQKGPQGTGSAPSISFVQAFNTDLGMYNGISNIPGGLTSVAQTIIQDSEFNFGQSTLEEIDYFNIDIEFPGGLFAVSENGSQYTTFVDFQVVYEYKNTADEAFNSVLVEGKDYGVSEFVAG